MSWKVAPIGRGGDLLYSQAGTPSLDLRFAEKKALTDYVSGTNLVSFTRASSGTYVGADGLIKTTPVNLILGSQNFTDGFSNRSNVTQNTTTSPIGDQTGSTLTAKSEPDSLRQTFACTLGVTYTVSVHVKQDTANTFTWRFTGSNAGINEAVTVYFANGTVSNGSIQALSNGWYRVSVTATATGNANPSVVLGIGSDTTHIWGLQVEEGTTATDYIPTTSTISGAPRFDHDPATGESLGLLIEESRTNYILNSDSATGSALSGFTVSTINSVVNPDGSTGTTQIQRPAVGSSNYRMGDTFSGTPGTAYAGSIYVRTLSGSSTIAFDVNDQNIEVFPVTEEWTRLDKVGTSGLAFRFMDLYQNDVSYSDTPILIWGAQLEAGSFPTSYIPTSGAQATRAADVAEITGTNFSSWYNQSEGTVFAESDYQVGSSGARIVGVNDGTNNNRHEVLANGASIQAFQVNGGVNEVILTRTAGTKAALAYALNDYALSVDSQALVNDTAATPPAVTQMSIGNWYNNAGQINGHINRLTYWQQRLPDTTLQTITT